uniref:EIF3_N domain-containing protein n=1 Tax=Macrostomum lignano TaxID=282301 RepID=A0A1I8GHW0_9PLAT
MTASEVGHNILLAHVMQMLHYLVRFGYYNSTTDIKKLLKPLLDLLDGRNDKPLPRAATTDYDKVLQHYQTVDRYKKSRETKAVVDAKHQAMRVLDLFFNFRFNVRLKRFVAEFKDVQFMAQNTLSSAQDPLAGLLNENYDLNKSIDTVASQRLAEMFTESSYFKDFDIVNVLLDLSHYEYPKMVQMSMWLLNRYYSAHNLLFKRAVLAQVLITDKSVAVHKMVDDESHVMRRLIGSKMTDSDVEKMCSILSKFSRVCHLEEEPEERHPMNQAILYNHGLLNDIFDLVSQDIDINLLVSRSSRFNLPYRIIKIELRCREMLYSKVLRVRSA